MKENVRNVIPVPGKNMSAPLNWVPPSPGPPEWSPPSPGPPRWVPPVPQWNSSQKNIVLKSSQNNEDNKLKVLISVSYTVFEMVGYPIRKI